MIKITIHPNQAFLLHHLKDKDDIKIIDFMKRRKAIQVLHYFGDKEGILLKLLEKRKVDLVISHTKNFYKVGRRHLFAYIPGLKEGKDLLNDLVCYTNCPTLTRVYFNKIQIPVKIKKAIFGTTQKSVSSTPLILSKIRSVVRSYAKSLKSYIAEEKIRW